jgi:uncharacterized membrane protein (UPF0182 family)
MPSFGKRAGRVTIAILLFVLLAGARTIASFFIEYAWWTEMGQLDTWLNKLSYEVLPVIGAGLASFVALWIAHARGVRFSGARLTEHPLYLKISTAALALAGYIIAASSLDPWTIVRFDLPFYASMRQALLTLTVACALVYWAAARGWQLRYRFPEWRNQTEIDPALFRLEGGLESKFLRGACALALAAFAVKFYLGRYEMVWNDHGFMVGVDYTDEHFALPMQWLLVGASVAAAGFVWARRWALAASMAVALVVEFAVPRLVASLYVRPNEISLEQPYIKTHIQATRSAFGLEKRVREIDFKARPEARIDPAKHRNLLDNVRLWDWRAFHDTVTQIQALRPYYVFADSDVDRYTIDGQYRQVLLTPRELDIRQLADARTRWINPHFIYTHGYGVVLAEVSKITADGLPVLLVQNAPAEVRTKSLKLTRPEIYYGEAVHEPVFVRTAQPEFNYPSGADNVHSRYEGKGGFPISSFGMRLAAAINEGAVNILLTGYLTPESRMMIHRKVRERLEHLAGFVEWDADPYLVVTEAGRLVWIVDGYTTSSAHPYSRALRFRERGRVNYIRNSVKATIDAYDGETRLYLFDPADPIVQAYRNLFPSLIRPAADMPADLRAHVRYPETLFRAQAEIYRTFHMLDPQAFYNKEDIWDLSRYTAGQSGKPEPVSPTYVVASLPGEDKPEFLLLTSFTPRSKDNLIGVMLARCDGENLGELIVLQLSKQQLVFGPMQISARINQDQTISKDLTLWNQQGSQVVRAQTLVLPVEDTFLYVDPIYIQATEARMPQLKKVVLAMGNTLIYADTYADAIAQLSGTAQAVAREAVAQAGSPPSASPPAAGDARIESIRRHLRRYRELASQGKWAEAGKELEAIEAEAR